ncbi:polysaccharide deacetylase family protein [Kiritimatiellaeota bacterium B1221]|nr:polysaccharide deacetylase family protein [Kiritimatiellaeota bacterium B1221]
MRAFLRGFWVLVCAVGGTGVFSDTRQADVESGVFTQTLTVEFHTKRDAETVSPVLTRLPDGKQWAMSARWDDNRIENTRMAELMAALGWPGTFFLNGTGTKKNYIGRDYVQKLVSTGSDIGGHSETHDLLPTLAAHEIFYEFLHNRIEKEVQSGKPVTTFAFPFGRYKSDEDPRALEAITSSFLAAGYLHSTYQGFVQNNLFLPEGAVSHSIQTRPGDRHVDLERYREQLRKVLESSEASRHGSRCLYLGIHVSYRDEGWEKIREVFQSYAGRENWWYCTLTAYAAYEKQRRETRIEKIAVQEAAATFRITRPVPEVLGAVIPLTLDFGDSGFKEVKDFEGKFKKQKNAQGYRYLTLDGPSGLPLPSRIQHVENPQNSMKPGESPEAVAVHLYCDTGKGELIYRIKNNTAQPLEDGRLVWRLPPLVRDNIRAQYFPVLPPGEEMMFIRNIGEVREDGYFSDGRAYFAVECNVRQNSKLSRYYATTRLPVSQPQQGSVRNAVWMMGPLDKDFSLPPRLIASTTPGSERKDSGEEPWMQWFCADEMQRYRVAGNRVPLFRNHKLWGRRMSSTVNKDRDFLMMVDFLVSEDSLISLDSGLPLIAVFLNGEEVENTREFKVSKGMNRVLLRTRTQDDRSGFRAYPAYVSLLPERGEIQFMDANLK